MNNTALHLLANTYSAFSPSLNAATVYYATPTSPFLAYAFLLFFLLISLLLFCAMWKIFTKAGKPGWASIIPIYNIIVLIQIAKKPVWWIFLLLIPLVNLIVGIIIVSEVARFFGKGMWFTIGLLCIPIVFYPILGYGSAQYIIDIPTADIASTDSQSTASRIIPIVVLIMVVYLGFLFARIFFLKSIISTKSNDITSTELAPANDSDAAIKANLANMRATGALFFAQNNSYVGVCSSADIVSAETAIQHAGGTEMTCNESTAQFAAAAKLPDNSGYWCIDSTGSSNLTPMALTGTACQ